MEGKILKLPLDKGNKLKENIWRLIKGEGSFLGWGKGKGREGMCEKNINSCVWKGVVHEKYVCKKYAWKDFHDKAYGVLFQIVAPPKSTVGFGSNLKLFLFRRCRRFFLNFSIISLVIKELHLPGIEGVVGEFIKGFP